MSQLFKLLPLAFIRSDTYQEAQLEDDQFDLQDGKSLGIKTQPIWHFISFGFHPVTWPQPLHMFYGTLTPVKYKGSRPSCST